MTTTTDFTDFTNTLVAERRRELEDAATNRRRHRLLRRRLRAPVVR